MRILLASDHAGFELKKSIIEHLKEKGIREIIDKGPEFYNEKDDYPDFIAPVARELSGTTPDIARGIIIGGSGQGEAMVANRFRGVRATVFYGGSTQILITSREHNNANVLSLGARFMTTQEALNAVDTWLETDFTGDPRHIRRIDKVDKLTC